jgi:transcription elongation factor Elf1
MVYGHVSIFPCPECGALMKCQGITTASEPGFEIAKCPNCKQEFEIVFDAIKGIEEIRLKQIN